MASQLGKHFVFFTLGELQDLYDKRFTIIHVRSADMKNPYLSVIVLDRQEKGDA